MIVQSLAYRDRLVTPILRQKTSPNQLIDFHFAQLDYDTAQAQALALLGEGACAERHATKTAAARCLSPMSLSLISI
jgi:hypothetical protein